MAKETQKQPKTGLYMVGVTLYISKGYLIQNGVNPNTIKSLFDRASPKAIIKIYDDCYIDYNAIPKPTQSALPQREVLVWDYDKERGETLAQPHIEKMGNAFNHGYHDHLQGLLDKYPDIDRAKLLQAAKVMAVWFYVLSCGRGDNKALYHAFCYWLGPKCRTEAAFRVARCEVNKIGVLDFVVDGRWYNTNRNPVNKAINGYIIEMLETGHNFTNVQMRDSLLEKNLSIKIPAERTFSKITKGLKQNPVVQKMCYGAENGNGPFATLIRAKNRNTQWQVDGVVVEIRYKEKNEANKWATKRVVMVTVMDSHSKMVIGYHIGTTEDKITILSAINEAARETNQMPREIVFDRHSSKDSNEMLNFKAGAEKMGVSLTYTSNPQYKNIIEHSFWTLGSKYFRKYAGYIGPGIKTAKSKNSHINPALRDKYVNNPPNSFEDIVTIIIEVIGTYNKAHKEKNDGLTPEQRYNMSESTGYVVDTFQRAALFQPRSKAKVSRDQVTITRGDKKYEFINDTFPMYEWNGKEVGYRYEDLEKEIYTYDIETDEAITTLRRKDAFHAARHDQTDADREVLKKHRDRLYTRGQQAIDEIESHKRPMLENPDDAYRLNGRTTPKGYLHNALETAENSKGNDKETAPAPPTNRKKSRYHVPDDIVITKG